MNITEIIEEGKNILNKNNIEDSLIISKELLCYILDKNKQYLIINNEDEVEKEKYEIFIENINKIISGIPIQYIINKQEFMKIEFYVDKNVLIPQPDTEILVENVLNICHNIKTNKIKILDLCTGSGAIAISIDKLLKEENIEAKIFASDISKNALAVAKKNNKINNADVQFIHSDLFENIEEKDFDIIVSNPPYIKNQVIKTLSKQVQNEPIIALDGGNDGLEFYKIIAEKSKEYIKNDGYLCLEIGYNQKKEVCNLLNKYQQYREIRAIKDLSNNDRCIISKICK